MSLSSDFAKGVESHEHKRLVDVLKHTYTRRKWKMKHEI